MPIIGKDRGEHQLKQSGTKGFLNLIKRLNNTVGGVLRKDKHQLHMRHNEMDRKKYRLLEAAGNILKISRTSSVLTMERSLAGFVLEKCLEEPDYEIQKRLVAHFRELCQKVSTNDDDKQLGLFDIIYSDF